MSKRPRHDQDDQELGPPAKKQKTEPEEPKVLLVKFVASLKSKESSTSQDKSGIESKGTKDKQEESKEKSESKPSKEKPKEQVIDVKPIEMKETFVAITSERLSKFRENLLVVHLFIGKYYSIPWKKTGEGCFATKTYYYPILQLQDAKIFTIRQLNEAFNDFEALKFLLNKSDARGISNVQVTETKEGNYFFEFRAKYELELGGALKGLPKNSSHLLNFVVQKLKPLVAQPPFKTEFNIQFDPLQNITLAQMFVLLDSDVFKKEMNDIGENRLRRFEVFFKSLKKSNPIITGIEFKRTL